MRLRVRAVRTVRSNAIARSRPDFSERPIGGLEIKMPRIKLTSGPLAERVVLLVGRVGDRGKELRVAQRAACVFRRGGGRTVIAADGYRPLDIDVLVLDQHHVMPVISEVIHIVEAA